MDAPHAVAAFALAAGLLTVTPGLDTALVLRTAAVEGPAPAMRAAFGIALGCLAWGFAAAVGLGALLAASRLAYDALRIAGALYILWLGMRMLAAAFAGPGPDAAPAAAPERRSWLMRGLLTNLLNPKIGVFYVTFLPLFVPAGADVTRFSLLLTTIHIAEGLLWFWLLTTLMRPLARWVQSAAVKRALDAITGGVLLAFGAGLFLERR
ncbi:MAG TPA: LysE family translocator [Rhizomicrobium sp.]